MVANRVMLIGVAKYILVVVFLFSSVSKILYPGIFFNAIQFYGITQNWLKVSIFIISIMLELSIWILLLTGSNLFKNGYLMGILLSMIVTSVFLAIAIFSGINHIETQCGCLGKLSLIGGSYLHIIFSTILFLLSDFLAFHQLIMSKQIRGLKIIIVSVFLLCFSLIQYYHFSEISNETRNELLKSSFFIQLSHRAINDISFNLESLDSWVASWKNGKADKEDLSSAIQDSGASVNSNSGEAIFSLQPVDTIGCKNCKNEYEIFANLRDINIGLGDSLYILDSKFRDIRIFDRDGNYVKTILVPDEILRPSSIAIRPDGKIYIAEQLEGKDAKVFLIDQLGRIINNFNLYFMPWLVRWKDGALFINSLPYYGNETNYLVHKYDPNGKLLAEFCHRLKNWAKICKYAGGTNGFLALSEQSIFFAFGSTYDIRSFSLAGDSLNKFYRSTEYFGDIIEQKAEGPNAPTIKFWTGFCLGMITVNNKYLLYFSLNKKEEIVYADVWSLAGNFLGSFKISNDIMPRPHVLLLTNDRDYIYMSIFYPYPHILKLELKRVT